MSSQQEIFIEIRDSQIVDKILSDLARYSIALTIKIPNKNLSVYEISPRSLNEKDLICRGSDDINFYENLKLEKITPITIQFNHYEDKYITQAHFKLNPPLITLHMTSPLFRVQRREDYRLRLPRSFKGFLNIKIENTAHKFQLTDLSAGGCRIEGLCPMPTFLKSSKEISSESTIEPLLGQLEIFGYDNIDVALEVRHLASQEKDFSVGLKFLNQSEKSKNKLAALVMDLYRTLFKNRVDKP